MIATEPPCVLSQPPLIVCSSAASHDHKINSFGSSTIRCITPWRHHESLNLPLGGYFSRIFLRFHPISIHIQKYLISTEPLVQRLKVSINAHFSEAKLQFSSYFFCFSFWNTIRCWSTCDNNFRPTAISIIISRFKLFSVFYKLTWIV